MLTIPDSIKALYKTDGVHKNFRVHFPNGELPDITNDNVVRESLHFTESLCSQDVFKFGLAEASVLEFETVGISNMYGMTIEASIEIDGSSLSAADKASIAAGTWDGTWDAVNEIFAIPLGSFKVDSCPRDHQNMAHRKLTAYTTYTGTAENSPFEEAKLTNFLATASGNYEPDITKLIYAAFGWTNQATRDALTKSVFMPWANIPTESVLQPIVYVSSQTYVRATLTCKKIVAPDTITSPTEIPADYLYGLELNGPIDMETPGAWLETTLANTGYYSDDDIAKALTQMKYCLSPYLQSVKPKNCFAGDIPIFYPKYASTTNPYVTLYVPTSVTFSVWAGGAGQGSPTFTTISSTPTLYQYTNTPPAVVASFPATGSYISTPTYVNCYDFLDILAGYTSLSGQFGRVDRLGGYKTVTLDPTSPTSVVPGDYAECWWDEYDVSPIGTVTVTYKDNDAAEMTAEIEIGSGLSRYDMTDNETLKSLSSADLTSVTNIITGDFATNAANVGFTPIDLTMQGWPWLEAGDALQITAEDGTTVDTYALRVEMSGIQNLQMAITAQGGTIIGEA